MICVTKNSTDTRNRQPEGAPNSTGGQFANEAPKPEAADNTVSTPEPIVFTVDPEAIVRRLAVASERLQEAEREAHLTAAADVAQMTLSVYPAAARVRISDPDGDGYQVEAILDAYGNELSDGCDYDDEEYGEIIDGMGDAVIGLPSTVPYTSAGVPQFGYGWFVEEEIEGHRGTTKYIDLAAAVTTYEQTATRAHLHAIAHEGGSALMSSIFDVILDREEVDEDRLLKLDAGDVDRLYSYAGRAVDKVQSDIEGA